MGFTKLCSLIFSVIIFTSFINDVVLQIPNSGEVRVDVLHPVKKLKYSYECGDPLGPSNWGNVSKYCNGNKQSPINISTKLIKTSLTTNLKITQWDEKPKRIVIKNSGKFVKIVFHYKDHTVPTLSGKLLGKPNDYQLAEIIYRFGENRHAGTEHAINNEKYGSEVQLVFYNSKYDSLEKASQYFDGYVVISRFLEVVEDEFTYYPIIPYIKKIHSYGAWYKIKSRNTFSIENLVGSYQCPFFSYHGSFTAPPCNEVVQWIVFAETVKIHSREIQEFRLLLNKEGDFMGPNIRPLQPLGQRSIKYYEF